MPRPALPCHAMPLPVHLVPLRDHCSLSAALLPPPPCRPPLLQLGSKGYGDPLTFDNTYYKTLLQKPWEDKSNSMGEHIGGWRGVCVVLLLGSFVCVRVCWKEHGGWYQRLQAMGWWGGAGVFEIYVVGWCRGV